MAESAVLRTLTAEEERRLREYQPRESLRPRKALQDTVRNRRVAIVQRLSAGEPVPEIARSLETNECYVRYVISLFNERGLTALGLPAEVQSGLRRKGRRSLRKRVKWLAGLLAVAAVAIAFRYGLWDSILAWWRRGESPEQQDTLWNLPMLWWGRIGKFLQFAAGLTVLLDILGPNRLERLAHRAATRADSARRMIGLARIGRQMHYRVTHLRTALQHDLSQAAHDEPPPRSEGEKLEAFKHVFAQHPDYPALLDKLHHAYDGKTFCNECMRRPLHPHHALAMAERRERLWDCVHGRFTFDLHVQAFVDRYFSRNERLARRMVGDLRFKPHWWFYSFLTSLLLWLSPVLFFWVMLDIKSLGIIFSTGMMFLTVIGETETPYAYRESQGTRASFFARTLAAFSFTAQPIVFASGVWRIASTVLNAVVRALDPSSPGRPLRKLAFLLFVIGFFFDVLAS